MTAPELKACPFCGNMGQLDKTLHGYPVMRWIYCVQCGASASAHNKIADAKAAWNARAALALPEVQALPEIMAMEMQHGEVIKRVMAERDEARAQVAMAYEVAAQVASDFDGFGIPTTFWPHEISRNIRALTPADATAALAARDAAMRNEGRRQAAAACDWGDIYGDNAVSVILATLEPEGGE